MVEKITAGQIWFEQVWKMSEECDTREKTKYEPQKKSAIDFVLATQEVEEKNSKNLINCSLQT